MAGATQLPLTLAHAPSYGRDDFVTDPSNRAALKLIESWPDWPSPIALLSGPPGSGKTHLAHIWSKRADGMIIDSAALFGGVPRLGSLKAVVVEDVAPTAAPEAPLFHLINMVRENGGSLLITASAPAEEWQVTLPDLRSRLRLATPAVLGRPEDALLRQVLVKLFADRQLLIDKPVVDYLLARMERSLSRAVVLVEGLDREALAAGRRITRQMAADILAATAETDEFADRQ